MTRLTVVGDAFLDVDWTGGVDRVCPDAPAPVLDVDEELTRPGGAGLAAVYASEEGAAVTLVTALGSDAEGDRVRTALVAAGVTVIDLGLRARTPVKLRLRAGGQSLARVDRHCAPAAGVGDWSSAATRAVEAADAVLVSDYGRGLTALAPVQEAVDRVRHRTPVVWDPHPRGAVPPVGLALLTPNLAEARELVAGPGPGATPGAAGRSGRAPGPAPAPVADAAAVAERLAERCGGAVVVTVGRRGAVLAEPGAAPVVVPVEPAQGDVCGAGDRFAAAAAGELGRGATYLDTVTSAVDAARLHVSGMLPRHGMTPPGAQALPLLGAPPSADGQGGHAGNGDHGGRPRRGRNGGRRAGGTADGVRLAEVVRARGGTVVAAGGCFDVVHAGHVRLLEAARQLGDCLVVCVNDDRSVRRLKGDGRPVNGLDDRIAVLEGLACVDAVVPFAEDTPCELLGRLRPHLFAKGADYAGAHLPERRALAPWGGRVVLLPLLAGRSTTRILTAAVAAS